MIGISAVCVTLCCIDTHDVSHLISFDSEDQMNRAMSILPQYKLMDRQLKVVHSDIRHLTFIYNVNPTEPLENVVKLCEDAAGEEGTVLYATQILPKSGTDYILCIVITVANDTHVPIHVGLQKACKVYFDSAAAAAKCAEALHRKSWKGRELSTRRLKTILAVYPIPSSVSEGEITRELQQKLGGDLQVGSTLCKFDADFKYKTAYFWFKREDCAKEASKRLQDARIWDRSLRATRH